MSTGKAPRISQSRSAADPTQAQGGEARFARCRFHDHPLPAGMVPRFLLRSPRGLAVTWTQMPHCLRSTDIARQLVLLKCGLCLDCTRPIRRTLTAARVCWIIRVCRISEERLSGLEEDLWIREATRQDPPMRAHEVMCLIEWHACLAIAKRYDLRHRSGWKLFSHHLARWARRTRIACKRSLLGTLDDLALVESSA